MTTAPVRLLLVEADPEERQAVHELLDGIQGRPCTIWDVSDLPSARSRLLEGRYDVCLMGRVEGQDGRVELIDEARWSGCGTPVIVLSRTPDTRLEQAALAAGACDYLVRREIYPSLLERAIFHSIERSRTLAALVEREREVRSVFDSALDAMITFDDQQLCVEANPAAVTLLGLSRPNLIGRSIRELFQGRTDRPFDAQWADFLSAGFSEGMLEYRLPDDQRRQVEFRLRASILPDRHLAVLRDQTEKVELQARLAQADRMASVGTLAAGVAHEINNPLTAILSNVEYVRSELTELALLPDTSRVSLGTCGLKLQDLLSDLLEALGDATQSAERIRHVALDLKLFSRPDEQERGAVDVRRVLDSSVRMAWNELRHRARVVRDLGPVPLGKANESRLGQVFLNLIVNAAQAMPEGDIAHNEIHVSTRQDSAGRPVVEIRDTGSGIAPEHLERIFEPFFTTKPVGFGTGLGLSICRRIIEELGGEISVTSQVGVGTRFTVTLPAADASEQAEAVREGPGSAAPVRRGKVLIIDDELLVARAIRRGLEPHHEVTTAASGQEALARFSSGERFDIILCDVMMPQLTGMDVHASLSRSSPEQAERMVFLTGGAFTPRARTFLETVSNLKLDKPVAAEALLEVVNDRVR